MFRRHTELCDLVIEVAEAKIDNILLNIAGNCCYHELVKQLTALGEEEKKSRSEDVVFRTTRD